MMCRILKTFVVGFSFFFSFFCSSVLVLSMVLVFDHPLLHSFAS